MATNAASYFARLNHRNRPKNAAEQPLRSFVDLFLTDKAAENRQPSYISELRRTLRQFREFLAEAMERDPILLDFSVDSARAFTLYEQERTRQHAVPGQGIRDSGRPLSTVTVRKNLRMLKVFSSWLEKEEWLPTNVLGKLELPKAEEKELEPLTPEEEARLARACDDRTRDGCRRLALLLLYLDTGARLNEIAGLRIEDVDLNRGLIKIQPATAKGRKGRSVAFGSKTERALRRYGMVFRDPVLTQAGMNERFFLSPAGDPITPNGIYQMFRRMAQRTGISRLHPHLLRHTSGTRDIERGKSTREVQNKLGHSSVTVTERYTHIVEREDANRRRDSHIDELPINVRKAKK